MLTRSPPRPGWEPFGRIEEAALRLADRPEDDPVAQGLPLELGCDCLQKRGPVAGLEWLRSAQERVELFVGKGKRC